MQGREWRPPGEGLEAAGGKQRPGCRPERRAPLETGRLRVRGSRILRQRTRQPGVYLTFLAALGSHSDRDGVTMAAVQIRRISLETGTGGDLGPHRDGPCSDRGEGFTAGCVISGRDPFSGPLPLVFSVATVTLKLSILWD